MKGQRARGLRSDLPEALPATGGGGRPLPVSRPAHGRAVPSLRRLSWQPANVRRRHAGLTPASPAAPATRAMWRRVAHAQEPASSRGPGAATARAACVAPVRFRRRARPSGAFAPAPDLVAAVSAARPRGGPSKARWRSPAAASARRACPGERARSPRGRTRRPPWRVAFPARGRAWPSVLSTVLAYRKRGVDRRARNGPPISSTRAPTVNV